MGLPMSEQLTPEQEGAAVRLMLEVGVPPKEVAELVADARRRTLQERLEREKG